MFENIGSFFKKIMRPEQKELLVEATSKDAAKERLHIVLMQDRANVSADFLELMKQEIIDVIKKYIVIDEEQIDVRLTNQENDDGTAGAPALYANIPILNIRNDIKGVVLSNTSEGTNVDVVKENLDSKVQIEEKPQVNKVKTSNENVHIEESHKEESTQTDKEEVVTGENSSNEATNENVSQEENEEKDKMVEEIKPDANIEENKEVQEIVDEDEDGEDVTFDDLLKKAKEAEKKAQNKSEKNPRNNVKNNNRKKTSKSNKKK